MTETTSKITYRVNNEILWAEIFNSTIQDSLWFKDKSLSPGRWAAGYPFLYALYRTLNEKHPLNILELGMGQTTKLISQYVDYCKGTVDYTVVQFSCR